MRFQLVLRLVLLQRCSGTPTPHAGFPPPGDGDDARGERPARRRTEKGPGRPQDGREGHAGGGVGAGAAAGPAVGARSSILDADALPAASGRVGAGALLRPVPAGRQRG